MRCQKFNYYHLKEYSNKVKAGDQVKQGQEIAVPGSTGNSTGLHLHLAVTQKVLGKCTKINTYEIAMIFDELPSRELVGTDKPVSLL